MVLAAVLGEGDEWRRRNGRSELDGLGTLIGDYKDHMEFSLGCPLFGSHRRRTAYNLWLESLPLNKRPIV
jgi:hypothetical protein